MKPWTHKQSERELIALVRSGEWEIDSLGRVWRACTRGGDRWRPGTVRLNPCPRRRAEKELPNGYLLVRAMFAGRRVVGAAHRLVWQHFHGDIPDGLVVNHINGQKGDNRPVNIELVTPSGNMAHAYRTGLKDEHGERNPAAKLTDHEVAEIRLAYACGGVTQTALALRYGVSFQHVSDLVRGRSRMKQPGPVSDEDHRHIASERDPSSGRFVPRELPRVEVRS